MANSYDGDITLSLGIDPKTALADAKDAGNKVAQIIENAADKGAKAATKTTLATLNSTNTKLQKVAKSVSDLYTRKSDYSTYKNLTSEADRLQTSIDKILETSEITEKTLGEWAKPLDENNSKFMELRNQADEAERKFSEIASSLGYENANVSTVYIDLQNQYKQALGSASRYSKGTYFKQMYQEEASSIKALMEQINSLTNTYENANTELAQMETNHIQFIEDEDLQKAYQYMQTIGELDTELGNLMSKYGEEESLVWSEKDDVALEKGKDNVSDMTNKVNALIAKLREGQDAANLFSNANSSSSDLLGNEGQAAANTENTLAHLENQKKKTSKSNKQLGNESRGTAKHLRTEGNAAKTAAKNLLKLAGRSIKNGLSKVKNLVAGTGQAANKSSFNFKKLGTTILKYGLGIRSFYFLFRKIRSAISEGFPEIAKAYEPFNQVMSNLKTSTAQLKGQLSSMFASLAMTVLPILTNIINKVTEIISKLSQLIGALSGQTTFLRATKVQQNYAGALEDTAEQAEETKRQLMGFDDVNILSEDKKASSGASSGDGASFGLVESPIESQFVGWANRLKSYFADIWKVFQDAWDNKGAKVIAAAKRALESIKSLIASIATAWKNVWTGGSGLRFLEATLDLVARILNIVAAIGEAFKKAWEKDNNGEKYLQSILDMLSSILELADSIGGSIQKAFESDTGTEIFENLLQIFTNIHETVGNIADGIKEAWDTAGLGDSIIQRIFDIVNNILSHINNITESTKEWAKELDFTPILESIDGLLEAIEPLAEDIGTALEYIWTEVLEPLGKWTIEEAAPTALNVIAGAIEVMSPFAEGVANSLKQIYEDFFKPLFGRVFDAILDAFDGLAEFMKKVKNNEDAVRVLQLLGDAFTWVLMPIPKLILTIKRAITDWEGFIQQLKDDWEVVKNVIIDILEFFGAPTQDTRTTQRHSGIDLGTDWAMGVLEGVEDTIDSKKEMDGVRDTMVKNFRYSFDSHSPSKVMEAEGVNLATGIYEGVKTKSVWDSITDIFNNATKTIDETLTKKDWTKIGRDTISKLQKGLSTSNIWSSVNTTFKNGVNNIQKTIKTVDWTKIGSTVTTTLKNGLANNGTWNTIKSTFSTGVNTIKKAFTNENWESTGSNVTSSISRGISRNSNSVTYAVTDVVNSAARSASYAVDNLEVTGWNMMTGLANGIYQNQNSVYDAIGTVTTNAINRSRAIAMIASPSKVFRDKIGAMMTLGLAEGITSEMPVALRAIDTVTNALTNTQIEIPDIVLGKITPYGNGGENNIAKLAEAINGMNGVDQVTNGTLLSMMEDVIDAINKIQFYIGDEQVARHAQTGTQKLNRRFKTVASMEI